MTGRGTVQGTVAGFDPDAGGHVLLDDGSSLDFPAQAVDPSLRRLRVGQRVGLRLEAGRVTALTLATLPMPPRGPARARTHERPAPRGPAAGGGEAD